MKCFYHTDMDGKCSAAIVRKYALKEYGDEGMRTEYIPISYHHTFPLDSIEPNERVFIVDFSIPIEIFEKLWAITRAIIWIDHHKTAIEKYKDYEYGLSASTGEIIAGLRKDGVSGCELTWEYLFPKANVPKVVKLLGDYDTWTFKYGEDTNRLQAGIKLWETEPTHINWEEWFKSWDTLDKEIDAGYLALKYRDNYYKSLIKAWSFYAEFEGYKCICCNAGCVSSQLFDSVNKNTFDIMIAFVAGEKGWTISLYTHKDIDCSEIAKKYGGGGHKKAAGFQCKQLFLTDGKIEIVQ